MVVWITDNTGHGFEGANSKKFKSRLKIVQKISKTEKIYW